MSKRESLGRYNLIIKKLRKHPATFKEIERYLTEESEIHAYNFVTSIRTFQRDLADIRSLYGIDIQFNRSEKKYYIVDDDNTELKERIIEAFDTYNALNMSDRLSKHIHFEKRCSNGSEHLFGILHAIKNKLRLSFWHQKFHDENPSQRHVAPYALKEFKNRWYLVAKDEKDERIKSFALDRIKVIEITKRHFDYPSDFDINSHFRYCFGIMGPNSEKPHEIILSIDPYHGKYIKSMPLHETQKIISDTKEELLISLQLYITFDFIMELCAMHELVKIIKPQILINQMKKILQNTLKAY